MHSLSLKSALILAFIPAAAAFAAGEEQDDKSYLPPAQFVASPNDAPAANEAQTAAEFKGRRVRFAHKRSGHRSYSSRRYARPFFLPF